MSTSEPCVKYTRADVKDLAGLRREARGGNWDTAIVEYQAEFLIVANVGSEGLTGHDYDNRWEVEAYRWYHKSRSWLSWPSVISFLEEGRSVHPERLELPVRMAVPRITEPPTTSRKQFCLPST